jgi:hypothetical protein
VVLLVPRDEESDCQEANLLLTGNATPVPGGIIERANQGNRGLANGGEFVEKVGKFTGGEVPCPDIVILFKAGKRGLVATGDAKKSVRKDTLGVIDVAKDFLDGPFAGSIAEFGLLIRQGGEQPDYLALLLL